MSGINYFFIKDLINKLNQGQIRIPSFQRGFVWDTDRIKCFIDSIYKGFPCGSLLFWRTTNPLKTERKLGPYNLPIKDQDYPIDYVLDGQQRIISIFGIFQNEIEPESEENIDWTELFFDINSQESIPFIYLDDYQNYDHQKYFPLKYVFDSTKYRKLTRDLDEDKAEKIDALVDRFKEAKVPIERFEQEERKYVASVFERINQQGLELDTFQLLSVWNWSEDFNLQEEFYELAENLPGFENIKSELLLKCCSSVIKESPDPAIFMELPSDEVRSQFDRFKNGMFEAIDFLKNELNISTLKLLPMDNILVVLCFFFASNQTQPSPKQADQYQVIRNWFWRACFSRRYARGGVKKTETDLDEIKKLKKNQDSDLGNFNINLDKNYFNQKFILSSIATKTFILMLAQQNPLDLIEGRKIDIDVNQVISIGRRKEFHHIFPRNYLKEKNYNQDDINCLANFCILSRSANNDIKDKPPGEYSYKMPIHSSEQLSSILKSHILNEDCFEYMKANDYEKFRQTRISLLTKRAYQLMGLS